MPGLEIHYEAGAGQRIYGTRDYSTVPKGQWKVEDYTFNWSPSNYQDNLLSVFTELQRKELHITPFMGSTDLAILGREGVFLIHISVR